MVEAAHVEALLGTISLEECADSYLQRAPIAQPTTVFSALALLDWQILGRVHATTEPPPDVLIVAQGKYLPWRSSLRLRHRQWLNGRRRIATA